MKLYKIQNTEKFLNVVDQSRGNVTLLLPDKTECDLKQNTLARELLKVVKPGSEGICIQLSDPDDAVKIMNFLIEQAS